MKIKYAEIKNPVEVDKLRFMKFVYDNSDSFIMNTFGYVWSGRDWWDKFPVEVITDEKGKVMCLHAYSINDYKPETMKTYYIITERKCRGEGLAKLLIKNSIAKNKDKIKNYYVNTDVKSPGYTFFKKWLGNKFTIEKNDFNSKDAIFEEPIYNLINE